MEPLYVIKIGGNVIDDEIKLERVLEDFASLKEKKILVHGGGKLATAMADKLGIPQQMVDGRRITDAETLKVVTMVYAGYINKHIVAKLIALGCRAAGFCGTDGNTIKAHKRTVKDTDFGYVGDIDKVDPILLTSLLQKNISVVMAPITHDGKGQLLNTNADTIAQELAKALSKTYAVHLIYSFEKKGVLANVDHEDSVISEMDPSRYEELKASKSIHSGMIPKLDNAFAALQSGVKEVVIGKSDDLKKLCSGRAGTRIVHA